MKDYNYIRDKILLVNWLEDNRDRLTIINYKGINILSCDDENFSRPYFENFYRLLYDYGIMYMRRKSMYVNMHIKYPHLYYKIHSVGLAQIIMKELNLDDGSFDQFIRCEKINEILA
jgi:hypothetical protein